MNNRTTPRTQVAEVEQAFPVPITMNGRTYQFSIWRGEQLPDCLLAFDTETAAIVGKETPPLALATVCGDAGSSFFIHPDTLPQFIDQHHRANWCCHNATFDFWVTAQHLQSDPQTLATWWDIAGCGRLYCTMLADQLIKLARIDAEPINRDLGVVARTYCDLHVDKTDPYRLRYGELIGRPVTDWEKVEPGFWSYAACDPIATLWVAQRQIEIAHELIEPFHKQLLPKALQRFGPLTCCLQVQGAIALDYISRTGVSVDREQVQQLHQDITELVQRHMQTLERLGGCELFRRHGPRSRTPGQYQTTPAGVVRRNAKLIKQRLEIISQAADSPNRPPRNADGLVTDSVKYWKSHRDLHPFINAYVDFSEQAKLMQFFGKLNQPHIYPRYRPLVRTGRTSCSNPNLQQLPRDDRFREMIVASPGHWLLQIDYSVLELRTLAQICLRRYGHSTLASLFRDGVDPHRYTAALLLGIDLPHFGRLPLEDQKRHRQRAKAINFGVPGALGAVSLVAYAKQAYGVEMELDEALKFRKRLITEVYPELKPYLTNNQHQDLADNLHTRLHPVKSAFGRREQMMTANRIVSGCTSSPDGEVYQPDLIQYVWLCLSRLNRNPELEADLSDQAPSMELMRRCFFRPAVTLSGRLRGHVGFAQRANSPFQGLAADGNKLALFRLLRAGYQVCGFVHDEALILIPDGSDYDAAVEQVQQILADAMQELTPHIPICTEYLVADRWYKSVEEQPRDSTGRILPYRGPQAIIAT